MTASRKWKSAGLLGFVLICMTLFFFLFQQAGGQVPWHDGYEVDVVLPEPINTVDNSDVRLGGVKVGRVSGIESIGSSAKITFEIDDKYAPIYQDATVTPRIKTLVGETYLEITPGTEEAGEIEDGGEVGSKGVQEVVPLERLLSTLDDDTRADIQRNLRGMGIAFGGEPERGPERPDGSQGFPVSYPENYGQDLNRLFAAMNPTVADGGTLMQILRGQRDDLAKVVDNTGQIMQAFADRTDQVRTLAIQAKVAAEAANSRDEQLRQIFQELPPTLTQARGSLGLLGNFSDNAIPVMRDLRQAMEDLTPTIVDLEPTARDARKLFNQLPGFVDDANPLIAQLEPLSNELSPAVNSLDALLRQANPAVDYLADYRDEVGAFFATAGDAVQPGDNFGATARVLAIVGASSLDDQQDTLPLVTLTNLLGSLDGGITSVQGGNTYPKPGTVNTPNDESNFERVEELP